MATGYHDGNHTTTLIALSSADDKTPVTVWADPTSHAILTVADTGVVGPGSSTDNAVVRFDGITGDTLQNSTVIINDTGDISAHGAALTVPLPVSSGGTGSATLIGAGIPVITSADLIAQSAAVASVVAVTSPNDANSHTYSVGGYITVTAISINTLTLQVTYTDETNAVLTQSFFGEGLTVAAISTTGGFAFPPMTIRVGANKAVTIKTTVVGAGSETYDVGGYIMQIN